MTPNIKKALAKFTKQQEGQAKKGLVRISGNQNIQRRFNRLVKLANRIRRKRARPEEHIEFSQLKKKLDVKIIAFNYYTREWDLE